MRIGSRAVVSVGLLVGFYVLVIALLVGIIGLDVLALAHLTLGIGYWVALSVPLVVALVRGLFFLERNHTGTPPGRLVLPDEQPELWALVRRLADEVGTRPPDEIRLVVAANAAVTEETRLLGLRTVRRRLMLGIPLLAGLTEGGLAAVLAHELAHYGNRDTTVGVVAYRGQTAIRRVVGGLNRRRPADRLLAALLTRYAVLYLRVSAAVCRYRELAADRTSARVTGRDAAAGALREVTVLDLAWRVFLNEFATLGWDSGFLPDRVLDGFVALLACPERRSRFDEIRANPPDKEGSEFDSHPPLAHRIAAIEAMTPGEANESTETGGYGGRPALALIAGSTATLDDVFTASLVKEAGTKRRIDWPMLAALSSRAAMLRRAERLVAAAAKTMSAPATIGTVLDGLDAGRLTELGRGPATAKPGLSGRAARELCRQPVRAELAALVGVVMADSGRAVWGLSWSSGPSLVLERSFAADFEDLLEAAVGDGEKPTLGLRQRLADAGVDLAYRPVDHDRLPPGSMVLDAAPLALAERVPRF